MKNKARWAVITMVSALALATTSAAFACDGDGKHAGGPSAEKRAERFKRADTNNDGFLTKAEVGDKRWEHLKVADANNDGKVSMAEIMQAVKDGKLKPPHRHEGKS
jgi:hypothetical protein